MSVPVEFPWVQLDIIMKTPFSHQSNYYIRYECQLIIVGNGKFHVVHLENVTLRASLGKVGLELPLLFRIYYILPKFIKVLWRSFKKTAISLR